ncbi:MAG TPA: iron-sulfur cluster assembly scaffold protein [Pyrinomonadaceae bacterium]|nr:iron-sulfur cluster assembly scaffold protein [Pyrinomonadaceae bacterium]
MVFVNGLVTKAFFNPKHVGEVAEPRFTGRSASFQCGAIVRVSLSIDDSQLITDAKFKAAGCSVLVGASSLLLHEVIGKTTAEAARIVQSHGLDEPGFLPPGKNACVQLISDALLAAIRSFSDAARDLWEGDEALICTCFCVSERTIEREIRQHRLSTIAEVSSACNAGAGCRSCYSLIEDILGEVNSE